MSGTLQRRLAVLLVTMAVSAAVWKSVPGSALDRAAFETVAGGFVNGPLFVSGRGTRVAPWNFRAFDPDARPDKRQALVIVALGDDVEGFFQSSPPAPIDMAVIFSNFQRLGATKAATAAVLAWETPDPIGLAALEKALAKFDALAVAAPLSRGPVSTPLPPAFRRASIPLAAVRGDTMDLPVVNRMPIPGAILGGDTASAGFSVLESEPPGDFLPLLARWDDRVVFSFPLVAVLQRLQLSPADVRVRLGESLRLGPAGPVLPIDRYGRLAFPLKPMAARARIPAEALIDGGAGLLPEEAPEPVILRDERSSAEPRTRAFSASLPAAVAAISSDTWLGEIRVFRRLGRWPETGVLAAAVIVLTAVAGMSFFRRNLAALLLAGAVVAAQWAGFGMASVWLPGLPLLAAVCAMAAVAALPELRRPVQVPQLPAIAAEPAFVPTEIPGPPKKVVRKAAKKAPAKKAPAKKAAKKAPAKKTAATKTPRTRKTPPPEP